ncbi:MAG TPA: SoxR reducing system RseC family protein [Aromatoleum sp.]|uniref:SoxR reducing system RseC family protein n=1 Tax=Aromatoleum sp. TaxID=2307007 RepID=UPI002B478DF7|nr:SoxR reducing system RseC family protein [Aromatoleum sp.]HJV28146.1 SoxR reducing system RseC family protein [Aromatoleum sp.]
MTASISCDASDMSALIEGTARVVAIREGIAWLEPEQGGSCGGCASAAMCGSKGIGTLATRLEARRFPLADAADLAIGERVVVGVREDALVRASLTAYAIPLVMMFALGALAQAMDGRDAITVVACLAGLAIGLGLSRILARLLTARGEVTPQLLRRVPVPLDCHQEHR